MKQSEILVIGAGPAGMMAAITAAKTGASVLVLERNEKVGRKLAITGKGRCNVTNTADIRAMEEQTVSNPRFILSSVSRFTGQDLMDYFEGLGVPLKVERGGRVFPVSDRAYDIVDALVKDMRNCGVKTRFQVRVQGIEQTEGGFIVHADGETYRTQKLILATGGVSYPLTGSTGDGYRFAETLGHTIISPKGGLVPLTVQEEWPKKLTGLSLRNVKVTLTRGGKTLYEDFGEMLFTHFGLSGPVVLSASSRVQHELNKKGIQNLSKDTGVVFHIDLKPALTFEKLEARIDRDFTKYAKKQLLHAMDDLLPKRLIPVALEQAGVSSEQRADATSKKERTKIVRTLKNLVCTVSGTRPVAEAIITQGGVSVKEVDPKTLQSKKVEGLYFAGELLDVDALTGGFNLQIAFSTGYAAGQSAAMSLRTS